MLLPDEWDESAAEHLRETTPLKRLGAPADVVAAVRFLLSGTDYVTGTILVVDGGDSSAEGRRRASVAAAMAPSTRRN